MKVVGEENNLAMSIKQGTFVLLQVQMLQQQVSVLADNQNNTDDRYTRAKQDSAALQARVHMLEEQLRESELRAEERLQEEQKRHREIMVRVEREKQLQIENCTIRCVHSDFNSMLTPVP